MSSASIDFPPQPRGPGRRGEPAWDIALLFPPQGEWTEEEYLALDTNHLIELSDGHLEVLPMPTPFHQRIVTYLLEMLKAFVVAGKLGEVLPAPLPVRLWPGQLREPDLVFVRPGRIPDPKRPPEGADLAMEVVSEGEENRQRDLVTKRDEYFRAGIQEYWIVDPEQRKITVLVPGEGGYKVHGEFTPGMVATSVLLPGFSVDVATAFAAGERPSVYE
jgi:Uma2 family endonuclease